MDPIVYVVDDDRSVCTAMSRLLRAAGYTVESYLDPGDFLRGRVLADRPSCLILDLQFPGTTGLEFQRRLEERGEAMPIIFLSGQGDVPSTVRAMKQGAVDFLTKPADPDHVLAAVRQALARDVQERHARTQRIEIRKRWEQLTSREREVCSLVVTGMLNKQIGERLKVTEKTVKVHRSRVMEKMQAASLADLVRMTHVYGLAGEGGAEGQGRR